MTRVVSMIPNRSHRILAYALPLAALPLFAVACGGDTSKPNAVDTVPNTVSPASTPVESTKPELRQVSADVTPKEVVMPSYNSPMDAYKAAEYKVASEMYKTKLESTPKDAYGHYMLGLSSWKSGDFTGAKMAFDKSIELDPKFAKAYFNEARVLLDMKRAPEALELIDKGRLLDSTSSDGWRLTARAQSESGDVESAMNTYRELLKQNDADAWGLNNLGMLMFNRGEVQEALGPLARAVQVKPTAPLFLNNLGMALEQSGHLAAALKHYELAMKHDPSYTKAVRNAERLKPVVKDSTDGGDVNVSELAEQFRLKVRSW